MKIHKKALRLPIIQGGMGVGISLGNLAGHVAKCGGAGTISAAQIGYREVDFYEDYVEANCRAIHQEMKKARTISPEGIIGFNLMVALNHYDRYAKEIIKAGADFIVSGAGLPMNLPAICGDADIDIAPIVSTERSAKVILKYWDKKYQRTADFLVIEGPEAGGHLGFDTDALIHFTENEEGRQDYQQEIKKILAVIRSYEEKYQRKIPVVYGGGIDNKEAFDLAMTSGIDAVQVASRFVTTVECDADPRYKMTYVNNDPSSVSIVESPVGMPGRAILNTFMENVAKGVRFPAKKCLGCIHTCKPATTPYCITDALIHAAKGEVDRALLFCGAHALKAKKLETVQEVVDSFF